MDNRKIILTAYLLAGFLVWFVSRSAIQYFYLAFYQIRRLAGILIIREALPVVLAAVVFIVLVKHEKVNEVLGEVVMEIKKVTWPGREDVVKSTTVVIICILIASFILAGFDIVWGRLVTFLLHT